jgi:Tol biopolymer transport system component/DNA-binding winged helix-turn-helix (wHTH) protein
MIDMSSKTPPFRFDGFSLDVDERTLTFQGNPIPLTPKAFQTLVLLVRNNGKVVEKEKFLDEVWADTYVEESTLAQNILTLRKALARFNPEKEFIVTVPRRGYQFVAALEKEDPAEELIVLEKLTRTHLVAEHHELQNAGGVGAHTTLAPPPPARGLLPGRLLSGRYAFVLAVLIISAFATGYVASRGFAEHGPLAGKLFTKFRVDPIVEDADIRNAVISPDGRYLAMLQVKSGVQSLYVRHVDTGNTVEIVPRINGRFVGANFSPTGDQIYYTIAHPSRTDERPGSTLYRIPSLGGASREIAHDVDSPASVSPDNKLIAFVRRAARDGDTSLILAGAEGGEERLLAARPAESGFTGAGVSWSPDSKLISTSVAHHEGDRSSGQICVIDASSGVQTILSNEAWASAGQTVWLKDGSGVVAVAYGAKSPTLNDELWIVSFPTGESRLVTNGINGAYGISLNASSNSIVAVESNKFACFLTAPVDNLFKNTHLLTTISDEVPLPFGADWTNDGKIVYSAIDSGNADIFTISEDGTQRTQLTSAPSAEIAPRLSADGRFLIFLSNRTGQMEVWRSDTNGTNTVQLTRSGHVREAAISPDGERVFYIAADPEKRAETLWTVSIDGQHMARLTDRATASPSISPDGETIAVHVLNPDSGTMGLALLSARTGELQRYLETPPNDDIPFIDWSKDGENLFVVLRKDKPVSLWKLPISGGQPQQLREWENDAIFRLAISRDGRRVFYEVGNELNSVVQLQNL